MYDIYLYKKFFKYMYRFLKGDKNNQRMYDCRKIGSVLRDTFFDSINIWLSHNDVVLCANSCQLHDIVSVLIDLVVILPNHLTSNGRNTTHQHSPGVSFPGFLQFNTFVRDSVS